LLGFLSNWSGVRDSNSFRQLGRLQHNLYANPALILGGRSEIRTHGGL
jgi:hypothetical protein